MLREKWRDLTQSCDKNPYTHRTIQKATGQHKRRHQNFDYTTIADRLRTVSWSNSSHTTGKYQYQISTYYRVFRMFLLDEQHINGQLASGKRANSFWQLSLDTNWNSLCVYNVGRQARSSDCIDTVLSAFKYIINIGCL